MNYTTHYNYAMPESTDSVDIDVLNQNFSDIDGDIYETKQLADSIDDRLDTAESTLLDNTDSIDSLGRRVDALDLAVGDVDSGLTKDVAGLVADVGLLESAVSDLDAQINTPSTGLDDRVEAVEDTLSSLQTTVGGISDDLDTCEGVVAGHTTDIAALDAEINTATTGLKDRVHEAEEDITDLASRTSALELAVGDASSGMVKDIDDIQDDITDIQNDIDGIEGDIQDLQTPKYLHTLCLKFTAEGTAFIIQEEFESATELDYDEYCTLLDGKKFLCKCSNPDYVGFMYDDGDPAVYVLSFDLTHALGYKWSPFSTQPNSISAIEIKEI